ncbi:MAG TPA: DNA mismatch repair protein MutS [Candidatus Blautia intestinipullorum]|nr:DNA mismatch repair protein MutS [Candidatus Blautia intestinipullorum]
MHPYSVVLLMAFGIVFLVFLWILYRNRKQRRIILKKMRRLYGKVPEREYSPGDIEAISHYFRRKAGKDFYIDDITWNDLDMDRIFMLVNQTVSSPGEDVLYSILRIPLFDRKRVEEREKLICFFEENPQKRETMQLLLSRIGKTWHGSLSDTILALEDAPQVNTKLHWVMFVLLILNLAALPFTAVPGFLTFTILSTVNIVIYYTGKDRIRIEAYLDCFSSLLKMLSLAKETGTVDWPETKTYMEKIRQGRQAFRSLKKRTIFLTGKNSATGDPSQLLLDYLRMVFHLDILVYNSILKDVKGKTGEITELLDAFGELDAAISIASFREMLPLWSRPEFTEWETGHVRLLAEDMYHPLIQTPVANSIQMERGILITGSNASGKSTFLKNLAVNSILAQTVLTCTCASYQAPFLKVMTSMALRDDLSGGESYFIVEIRSLKRILDESRKEEPFLCIIDEVLRGTNTIERIAASSRILSVLDRPWILPAAATHDIELSYILSKKYENYHFEEEIQDDQVVFNYLLQRGRTTTRNAIRLLGVLGYDDGIVREAARTAADFEKTGIWKEVD